MPLNFIIWVHFIIGKMTFSIGCVLHFVKVVLNGVTMFHVIINNFSS